MNSRWKLSKKTYIIAASIIVGLVILGIAAQFLIKASADTTPKTYTISNNASQYQSQNLAITDEGVLGYATVSGTSSVGTVTTKISNIVQSNNNTHWMDGQQRVLSTLTDAQLAQVATTLNGISAPTYNGVTTSPSLQGNDGVGLVMQIAPPTGIPAGVKINSVSATLYQIGSNNIGQVGLSNSLANTQTEMMSGNNKCTNIQCTIVFGTSFGKIAWTAADLNNLSIAIMPQPAFLSYGLDKLVISVTYSTDLLPARVKPTLANMTDSLSPTTVWNNAIIQGGVTIPAGTGAAAKIRWYVSNTAAAADAMANKDYAASSLGVACDSGVTCSAVTPLSNNPGSTSIPLNRITGQYATFVLGLYAPTATAKPRVYKQIQVNFTAGAASAPAPASVCPAITGFTPITVAANPANQILTVNGADFGTTTGQISLAIDGSTNPWVLTATSWTATKITANLPTNLPAGTYSVYIKISDCSASKSPTALVVTAGTVTPTSPSPTCAPITAIVGAVSTFPTIAMVGQTPLVNIIGIHFGALTTGVTNIAYLGALDGTAQYPLSQGSVNPWWTDTRISGVVPANTPAGTYNVYFKVGTCTALLAGQITLQPASVAATCPTTVLLSGNTHQNNGTKVYANENTPLTISGTGLNTSGTITMVATNPAQDANTYNIPATTWNNTTISITSPKINADWGKIFTPRSKSDLQNIVIDSKNGTKLYDDVLSYGKFIGRLIPVNPSVNAKEKTYHFVVTPTNCPAINTPDFGYLKFFWRVVVVSGDVDYTVK